MSVTIQTRAVLAAARSQGPTLTHVFVRNTVSQPIRQAVLCGRVRPENLADEHAMDTATIPTCPICRSKDPRLKPRAILPSEKAAKRLRKDIEQELPKLHRIERRLGAAWTRAVQFENLYRRIDTSALDRALAQLTTAIRDLEGVLTR